MELSNVHRHSATTKTNSTISKRRVRCNLLAVAIVCGLIAKTTLIDFNFEVFNAFKQRKLDRMVLKLPSKDATRHQASPKRKVRKKKSRPVKRIALLGERHSGTTWLTTELQKCFPSLPVSSRLLRWKHWFQDDDGKGHRQTLVISLFRNPYEWTEAMRTGPHHAPNHLYLKWYDFVTKEWGTERPRRDLELWERSPDGNNTICQEKFKYNEILSCVKGSKDDEEFVLLRDRIPHHTTYSGFKPFYELKRDGSGEPYGSILELRAAKIRNYLSVKEWYWVEDSIPVQYEALLRNGTDFLLSMIEDTVGIQRECDAIPSQERSRRPLKKEFVDWMTDHIDWEAESLIGYKKWGEEEGENLQNEDETEERSEDISVKQ
mmetsp:Transcript_10127/g.12516  ORF Transcript_10127/g.12516 Transcript_10127/m.12516 type:complete len:376 (-) Transcript_10127:62-1189(-)|eukprot:CAMPEP_0172502596 /NCGR_PEP_ID=MMETSP1066-20121228/161251_1 /TAXON_ID=671091 /ORGANISM="Coscinodiscus wailesii, Strain CCMP2513" /LENGTH=375 /DNA_ID=CAMNT_0013277901 /DNA_START=99 /DNA_END=1226 /DNA_ORIENTATION=-